MAALSFLSAFKKTISKIDTVFTAFGPPSYWYSTGNYALNNIISGSFVKGIPQNRITVLAGESGAGKSFVAANIAMHAQEEGAFVLALDSENALDKSFLSAVGVKTDEDHLQYVGVTTFSDVTRVISEFITSYEKAYGKDTEGTPKVVILLDSLDMLLTDSETNNFESGVQKGDQGQRAKQAKHMLRTIVSRISRIPVSFVMTHQVYPNTDLMNGQGKWIVNNAVKYSASQIMLISKLKLKEGTDVIGIRMRIECFKSRFAKLGSKVEVEVPYTSGMSPFSGLVELLEEKGVLVKQGFSYVTTINGEEIKFREKNLTHELVTKLLTHPILVSEEQEIAALIDGDTGDDVDAIVAGKVAAPETEHFESTVSIDQDQDQEKEIR